MTKLSADAVSLDLDRHDGVAAKDEPGDVVERLECAFAKGGEHGRKRLIARKRGVGEAHQADPGATVEIEPFAMLAHQRALEMGVTGDEKVDFGRDAFIEIRKIIVFFVEG